MDEKCLEVFTSRSIEQMCAEGGSQAWTVDPAKARECQWLICSWNTRGAWGDGSDPGFKHGQAFLIAPIDSIERSREKPSRWIVRFSKYARLSLRDCWNGQRLPFRYMTLNAFNIENGCDIEVADLSWIAVSPQSNEDGSARELVNPQSVVDAAKTKLARTFNVRPENIEITIRI